MTSYYLHYCTHTFVYFLAPKEHIDAILDEQIIFTRDGGVQRFLVRWHGRPNSDDTWITSDDLQQIDRDLFEYYHCCPASHSTESSFLHPGRVEGTLGPDLLLAVSMGADPRRLRFRYD